MTLHIGWPHVKTARAIRLGVAEFLKATPPGMKLTKLTLSGLDCFDAPQCHRKKSTITILMNAMCDMLTRQDSLAEVDLSYNCVEIETGSRILGAMVTHNDTTLTFINLDEFFSETAHVAESPAFLEEIGKFKGLTTLILSFNYLGETTLEQLSTGSPFLEALSLRICEPSYDHPLVTTAGWLAARQRCPKLEVFAHLWRQPGEFQPLLILPPGMPVVSLTVHFFYDGKMQTFENLFSHVRSHFAPLLRLVHLETMGSLSRDFPSWILPKELVALVAGCRSLTCLSMDLDLPQESLLQLAATPRPLNAPLEIHLSHGHIHDLGNRNLQRLSALNPLVSVYICYAAHCCSHIFKAELEHD